MVKLIDLINKYKYYFNLNLVKLRIGKKQFQFNIDQIIYEKPELRDIKNNIINHYYHSIKFNTSFKQHFFNHLIAINEDIGKKSNLIKYLSKKRLHIDQIYASFISEKDKGLFCFYNINIKEIKPNRNKLSPISVLLWFLQQYQDYRLKRNLFPQEQSNFNPNIEYKKMLRAWFVLSENIYVDKLKKSLDNTIIYVTPHIKNRKITLRQKNYLEFLNYKKRNYFFYVPRINFLVLTKIAIKIYFSLFPVNLKIPLLNIMKERMEIDDFSNFIKNKFPSVKEFYTKEEFLPESVYLTEKLKELKIKVINSAHGLGVYGTIINYDVFNVFTKIQKDHYNRSSNTKFELFNPINSLRQESISNKEIAIFFIHQNVLSSPSRKSSVSRRIYEEILDYIEKIALDLNIPVFVKYHPGSTKKDKVLSNNINVVDEIEDLQNEYKYIAITLHSSYVLELLGSMPFLVVNPYNHINMKELFPEDNAFYANTYRDFKEKIQKFLEDREMYYKYWNKLISSISNI